MGNSMMAYFIILPPEIRAKVQPVGIASRVYSFIAFNLINSSVQHINKRQMNAIQCRVAHLHTHTDTSDAGERGRMKHFNRNKHNKVANESHTHCEKGKESERMEKNKKTTRRNGINSEIKYTIFTHDIIPKSISIYFT